MSDTQPRGWAKVLARQSLLTPLGMAVPMIAGLLVAEHDSVRQHMSELQLLGGASLWSVRIGAIVAGVSIAGFGVACLGLFGRLRFSYTTIACLLFGAGMISNGVFVTGSPLHGLWGLPVFSVLAPALFFGEFHRLNDSAWLRHVCSASAVLSLIYMWLMLSGFDPAACRGLTQRAATIFGFVWFPIAAWAVMPGKTESSR